MSGFCLEETNSVTRACDSWGIGISLSFDSLPSTVKEVFSFRSFIDNGAGSLASCFSFRSAFFTGGLFLLEIKNFIPKIREKITKPINAKLINFLAEIFDEDTESELFSILLPTDSS